MASDSFDTQKTIEGEESLQAQDGDGGDRRQSPSSSGRHVR